MGRLTEALEDYRNQKGGATTQTITNGARQNMDISGWVYSTLSNLSSTVRNSVNIMNTNMNHLDYENMRIYMTSRTRLISILSETALLTYNMSYNFINSNNLTTQPILTSNLALSNIIMRSNAIIASNLDILNSAFNIAYSNANSNISSNITNEYSNFIKRVPYNIRALQYINNNMTTAYQIMAASNYLGKYSYYYDHISAMLGRNSNILKMAQTSNYPRNVSSPNAVIYNYNSLYYPNGNIILASSMYPYISDRYLGSNYNNLSNQFMTIYNTPRSTPNSNQAILLKLQACNAIFTVDDMQLSSYSNRIARDSNIATAAGLRSYIPRHTSAIFAINDPVLRSNTAVQISGLYIRDINPTATRLMSNIETVLNRTQTDMYLLEDADFSNLTNIRLYLKQSYLMADHIKNNNSNYFKTTFSNSNGATGDFFFVNDLEAVCTLGAYMSNDASALNTMMISEELNSVITTFQRASSNSANIIKTNITNTLSNINFMHTTILNTTNYIINRTTSDIQKLRANRLDGSCFTFYPTVISASNQLKTILTSNLPALYREYSNASNTYMTTTSLSNLNTMSESLLYTSNNLYSNYLTASNFSNTLSALTDDLVITLSNTYSNYPLDVVFRLPVFTGSNCA